MFSGLYGDLPQAKDEEKEKKGGGGWAGSGLLAPTKRPAVAMAPPPSVLRAAGGRGRGREGPGPVAAGGRGRGPGPVAAAAADALPSASASSSFNALTAGPVLASVAAAPSPLDTAGAAAIIAAATGTMSLGQDIQDEYDPARPNDYEQVRKERERQRKEAEAEAERQERLREIKELEELEMQRQEVEPEPLPPALGAPAAAAAPQPIQLDEERRREMLSLSGDEAFRRRGMAAAGAAGAGAGGGGLGGGGEGGLGFGGGLGSGLGSSAGGLGFGGGGGGGGPGGGAAGGQPKGMGLAQKLLEKMGWREGEGLGRNRQGISAPLMMQKTDVRSGVIVSAGDAGKPGGPPPEKRPKQGAVIQGTPSKVVLLTNVVGPGEVDEQLEEEVGQECTKYGAVQSVLIFEATEPGFPADQAVRIFVEFSRIEEATKCLVDMQGRFFGGRSVSACFFDEDRFERNELAPRPEEVRR